MSGLCGGLLLRPGGRQLCRVRPPKISASLSAGVRSRLWQFKVGIECREPIRHVEQFADNLREAEHRPNGPLCTPVCHERIRKMEASFVDVRDWHSLAQLFLKGVDRPAFLVLPGRLEVHKVVTESYQKFRILPVPNPLCRWPVE